MAMKKSPGTKTSVRKPAKKNVAGKKTTKKKAVVKKPAGKKAAKKSAAGRSARKIAPKKKKAVKKTKPAPGKVSSKEPVIVQPGPPLGSVPPVEEPSLLEEAIGIVTHYYSHLGVAVVQVNKGSLKTGDRIHITGHTTDFTQSVVSMEYEHRHVDQASAGQSVGLRIADHAREHDIVYLVK